MQNTSTTCRWGTSSFSRAALILPASKVRIARSSARCLVTPSLSRLRDKHNTAALRVLTSVMMAVISLSILLFRAATRSVDITQEQYEALIRRAFLLDPRLLYSLRTTGHWVLLRGASALSRLLVTNDFTCKLESNLARRVLQAFGENPRPK